MKQSTSKVKTHNVAHLGPILGYGHWTASVLQLQNVVIAVDEH